GVEERPEVAVPAEDGTRILRRGPGEGPDALLVDLAGHEIRFPERGVPDDLLGVIDVRRGAERDDAEAQHEQREDLAAANGQAHAARDGRRRYRRLLRGRCRFGVPDHRFGSFAVQYSKVIEVTHSQSSFPARGLTARDPSRIILKFFPRSLDLARIQGPGPEGHTHCYNRARSYRVKPRPQP